MVIGMDEFANGNPAQIYARMRPDQRTAIAGEFVRALRMAGDPRAAQFEQEWNGPDAPIPHMLSAEQVAAVHTYTREQHPDLIERIAQHPVTLAALANAGTPAAPDATPAEPATIWKPEALVDSPSEAVLDVGRQAEPAPSPAPEPIPISDAEMAEHEMREHNPTNEEIAAENPGPEL